MKSAATVPSTATVPVPSLSTFHNACWIAVRRVTASSNLTISYVPDGAAALPFRDQWKAVTCPDCGDTFQVSGYGLTPGEVIRVRQSVLAACLGL